MGDMADDAREYEMMVELKRIASILIIPKRGLWKTKQGHKLRIKEMDDSHIKNCIVMLKKLEGWECKILEFEAELAWREYEDALESTF